MKLAKAEKAKVRHQRGIPFYKWHKSFFSNHFEEQETKESCRRQG